MEENARCQKDSAGTFSSRSWKWPKYLTGSRRRRLWSNRTTRRAGRCSWRLQAAVHASTVGVAPGRHPEHPRSKFQFGGCLFTILRAGWPLLQPVLRGQEAVPSTPAVT